MFPLCPHHHDYTEGLPDLELSVAKLDYADYWSANDLRDYVNQRLDLQCGHPSDLLLCLQGALADHSLDSEGLAEALCLEGQMLRSLNRFQEAYDIMLIVGHLHLESASARVARECGFARTLAQLGHEPLAAVYASSALEILPSIGRKHPLVVPTLTTVFQCYNETGRIQSIGELLQEENGAFDWGYLRSQPGYGRIVSYRGFFLRDAIGDMAQARHLMKEAMQMSEGVDPEHYWWRRANIGLLDGRAGRLEAAATSFADAVSGLRELGRVHASHQVECWLAELLVRHGRRCGDVDAVHDGLTLLDRLEETQMGLRRGRLLFDIMKLRFDGRSFLGNEDAARDLQRMVKYRQLEVGQRNRNLVMPPRPYSVRTRRWNRSLLRELESLPVGRVIGHPSIGWWPSAR